jgi:hypothetical protein
MPHRRHTITVATSTLFFVCLVLHAQTNLYSQTLLAYNNSEAYKVYEALLPTDWTLTAGHARRLLVQAQTGSKLDFCLKPDPESAALLQPDFKPSIPYEFASSEDLHAFFKPGGPGWKGLAERYPDSASSFIVLSPVAFNAGKTIAVVYKGHSCGSLRGGGTFHVLEKKDAIWRDMSWRGTSCAWAS